MKMMSFGTGRLFPMFSDFTPKEMVKCDICSWKLYCIVMHGITICPWCLERLLLVPTVLKILQDVKEKK